MFPHRRAHEGTASFGYCEDLRRRLERCATGHASSVRILRCPTEKAVAPSCPARGKRTRRKNGGQTGARREGAANPAVLTDPPDWTPRHHWHGRCCILSPGRQGGRLCGNRWRKFDSPADWFPGNTQGHDRPAWVCSWGFTAGCRSGEEGTRKRLSEGKESLAAPVAGN